MRKYFKSTVFYNTLIAHKGIYGRYKNGYVKPNSFKSCKLAIDNNIDFECDVRNTLDNIAVLAHDNVIRINGEKIKISRMTYEDLCFLLPEKPTKLEDVLKYNNGKVGIIVDAKEAHIFYSEYRKNLVELLNNYAKKGEVMIQSFNPLFMLSIGRRLKNVLTGQLVCRGRTILDSFKTPKTFAYAYERIISLICFISRTDIINIENHESKNWKKRTKFVLAKEAKIAKKKEKTFSLMSEVDKMADKIQLQILKETQRITKKPIMVFTIENEEDFGKMNNIEISNYIVDYSRDGVEEYIKKIKEFSKRE